MASGLLACRPRLRACRPRSRTTSGSPDDGYALLARVAWPPPDDPDHELIEAARQAWAGGTADGRQRTASQTKTRASGPPPVAL